MNGPALTRSPPHGRAQQRLPCDPQVALAHARLAIALQFQQKLDQANDEIRKAIELKPAGPEFS